MGRKPKTNKTLLTLRLGLAFVLAYAAIRAFINPNDWIGFIPNWVLNFGFTKERFLMAWGMIQIVIALLLISNFKARFLGLVIALMQIGIVLISGLGLLDITFRDVGLAAAGLALFFVEE